MIHTAIEKDRENQSETELTWVHTTCCICGRDDSTLVGKGKDFEYHVSTSTFSAVRCNACGLIYLNPRPASSELEKFYPSTYHAYHFSKKDFGIVYSVRSWLEARRLLRHCRDLPDDASILDVGCGDGFHLGLLSKFGKKTWHLEGIDNNRLAVEQVSSLGFQVHLGSVEELDLPNGNYDLVFLIMTVEHVERPDTILRRIYKLLKNGGRLVIVTDNTGTLDFRLFKKSYWGGYHFPRHLNLFDRRSLSKLATSTGFEVERLTTIVSPVNWIYSIHNRMVARKRPRWLINCFTLRASFTLAVFTVFDFMLGKFGKGGVLHATLHKPATITKQPWELN